MANGYFERGEVYWIGKPGTASLGVVISADKDNTAREFVVVAAICGDQPDRGVATNATGRTSYVACANVKTQPKNRFSSLVGRLTPDELKRVDDHLEEIFDLGYEDDGKDEEIARLKSRVTQLESQLAYANEGIMARSTEMNNYKKKYENAVERIVDLELDIDVARRKAERIQPVGKEELPFEPQPEPEPELVPGAVNINTATGKELVMKLGVSKEIAYSITGYRKKNGRFVCLEELLDVPRMSKAHYERCKPWITIEDSVSEPEVEPEPSPEAVAEPRTDAPPKKTKVNVNTATIEELMSAGFSKPAAGKIVAHRKKFGGIKNLDELRDNDEVSGKILRKLRDNLEV